MKFCPGCKSTDIDIEADFKGSTYMYVCQNCGFRNWSLPEMKKI